MFQIKPKEIALDQINIEHLIESTHNGNIQIMLCRYGDQKCVLKSVQRKYITTQEQMENLFNERQALFELSHPLINSLIGTAKDADALYFILRCEEGIPLHKLLYNGPLTECLVEHIMSQIFDILNYLHSEGWIYRDLKASNVLLCESGEIRLVDFGFAEKIENNTSVQICGTTHMMPIEVINGQPYSFEYDIYAAGVLFYELLTGLPPFGFNNAELIKGGLTNEMLSKVSLKYRQIISDLMHPNPKLRKVPELSKTTLDEKYREDIYLYNRIYQLDQDIDQINFEEM